MTTLTASLQSAILEAMAPQDALSIWRQKAFEKFEKSNVFSRQLERYQYVRLNELKNLTFKPRSIKGVDEALVRQKLAPFQGETVLVLYDGCFLPQLSQVETLPIQIVVKPYSEAYLSYGVFFKNYFEKWLKEEKDPLATLPLALEQEGLFIYVPKNHVETKPIYILEINEKDGKDLAAPNVFISCGKNSEIIFQMLSFGDGENAQTTFGGYFFNIEENARVQWTQVTSNNSRRRFDFIRANLKRSSYFKAVSCVFESKMSRADYHIQLLDENAEAEIYSLATLAHQERAHTHILVEHKAENCLSRQLVKNLLSQKSTASFEGKIWVQDTAQKTNAYQLNQNCLLSDEAKAYSKPNLEIFADDVKASHGSTTGHVDQEALFYLQSRGLSTVAAQKLLLASFCQEVTKHLQAAQTNAWVQKDLIKFFEGL